MKFTKVESSVKTRSPRHGPDGQILLAFSYLILLSPQDTEEGKEERKKERKREKRKGMNCLISTDSLIMGLEKT